MTKKQKQTQERQELSSRLPEYSPDTVSRLTDEDLRVLFSIVSAEVQNRAAGKRLLDQAKDLGILADDREPTPVRVFGPNLNGPAQKKGMFHVHAPGCGDCKHYGPGSKFGGDDAGWEMAVGSRLDVVEEVYGDQLDENPGVQAKDWLDDFHFAPCLKSLPEEVVS